MALSLYKDLLLKVINKVYKWLWSWSRAYFLFCLLQFVFVKFLIKLFFTERFTRTLVDSSWPRLTWFTNWGPRSTTSTSVPTRTSLGWGMGTDSQVSSFQVSERERNNVHHKLVNSTSQIPVVCFHYILNQIWFVCFGAFNYIANHVASILKVFEWEFKRKILKCIVYSILASPVMRTTYM